MATSLRLLLFAAAVVLFAVGCMHRREQTMIPRPQVAAGDGRATNSSFAELQQNAGSKADNKVRGQGMSQNDSSGARLTNWEEQANAGDRLPISDNPSDIQIPGTPPSPSEPKQGGDRLHQPRTLPGSVGAARSAPTALGQHLQLGPHELAAERAVLLSQLLDQAQSEGKVLRERVAALEQQLEVLQRTRPDLTPELEQATDELRRSRLQMEALHAEVATLRERLRRLDKQELDTLSEVVVLLEQMARETSPQKPKR